MFVNRRKRSSNQDSTGYQSTEKKLKIVLGDCSEWGDVMQCTPTCVEVDDMEDSSPEHSSYNGMSSNAVMESKTCSPHCMDLCIDDVGIDGASSHATRHKGRTIGDYCSESSFRKGSSSAGVEMKTGVQRCQGCQQDGDVIINCDFCDRRFCNRRCIAMCCSCGGRYCVHTCSTLDYSTLFVQPLCLDCKHQFALC